MLMHPKVGDQEFVKASLNSLIKYLNDAEADVKGEIAKLMGWNDDSRLEVERQNLILSIAEVKEKADAENPMPYTHYASRLSIVGCYQSVLAKVFSDIPELQGYGDANAIWVITPIEEIGHLIEDFFSRWHHDVRGEHKPFFASFLKAWKELPFGNAPYPAGTPETLTFDDECMVALLADWGGDNPAAKKVASQVIKHDPAIAIHLGDIYYGGTKSECELFVANWPVRKDGEFARANANFALNGNHEMYTGGKSYFDVVLPAFRQSHPFFCLENSHWRLIGLDTAYNNGSLRPGDPSDPLTAQWDWLVAILKKQDGRRNILLTHHQPVSAHLLEFGESEALRKDISALLDTEGIDRTAIFGWFFGHEHRCAIYDVDPNTNYQPRLIGSGCIPHLVQQERASDPGCTPAQYFNWRSEPGNPKSAVSMFTSLAFVRNQVVIHYVDEDGQLWGSETWYSDPGRFEASGFAPAGPVELSYPAAAEAN